MREREGRQDRFRGGLVKDVRFSDPRCLPSIGAARLRLRRSANEPRALVEMQRSRDEDRHFPNEPSSFRLEWPSALARFRSPARFAPACSTVARPPSARLLLRPSFRPVRCRARASLSPKTPYRLLQYDDARALAAGRRVLDRGGGRRAPRLRSLFAASCGATRATSHAIHMHPKTHGLRGPTNPSEGLRAFRRASPLLESIAHPVSSVRAREEDGCPFRISRTNRA